MEKERYKVVCDATWDLVGEWTKMVHDGDIGEGEMLESLRQQLDGTQDMGLDELTNDRVEAMGYPKHNTVFDITPEQQMEWRGVVNAAAIIWISTNTTWREQQ